jgi:hypothetical protein
LRDGIGASGGELSVGRRSERHSMRTGPLASSKIRFAVC